MIERFEKGFSGGLSGFGDQEFAEIIRDRIEVPGTGLTVSSLRSAAHRQLIGSIVTLGVISAFSAFAVMKPAHTASLAAIDHRLPNVQQPILETPSGDRLAAVKHKSELP